MRVVLSATARADLQDIAAYIARDNKARARTFVAELVDKAKALGSRPRAFALVPRYQHLGIRRRPYGNYLIYYRVEDSRVLIVHIVHGARDQEALLARMADP